MDHPETPQFGSPGVVGGGVAKLSAVVERPDLIMEPVWLANLTFRVDLNDPGILSDFESWKLNDGSEDGLRALVERSEAAE